MAQSNYSLLAFVILIIFYCRKLIRNYQARQVRLGLFSNGMQAHTNGRLTSYSRSSMDVYHRLEFRTRDPGAWIDSSKFSVAIESRA
jgi:hypothetical protein